VGDVTVWYDDFIYVVVAVDRENGAAQWHDLRRASNIDTHHYGTI
jgi:hypothetical protein